MLRPAVIPPALLAALALPLLAGCEQFLMELDELTPAEPPALKLPVLNRTRQQVGEEAKVGAPDLGRIERDPFLTADENETRRRANMPKVAVAVARPRAQRAAPAPLSAGLEVIRRELSVRVPLIIVGENGRKIAMLADANGTVLEEGQVIENYYLVEKIEEDYIRIGSTDGKYRTRLPFAQSAPDSDRARWDLKGTSD